MSDLLDLMERLGQDSNLRYASPAVFDSALNEAQLRPELRAALSNRDQQLLEKLLSVGSNVCCLINAPEQEDDRESVTKKDVITP